MSVEPAVKELFQAKNFGSVSVRLPSGSIGTTVMWVDADDEHIVFNTEVHRAKYKALESDPTVTVTAWDAENPYHYAEVRGKVVSTETGPPAKAHIDALAKKYMGVDDYPNPIQSERVIVRVAPERQRVQ
jgi:PPOX class probable F420-dependent enzyme